MSKVAIVTDSACCIPEELVREYGICVVPLFIIHKDKSYRDGIDISPSEVYQIMRKRVQLPTTSVPSAGVFLEAYRQMSEEAGSILCITITARQSKIFDTALVAREMAKEELPDTAIEVLDSRAVAGSLGFIVLEAARAAREGASLPQVVESAQSMMLRVNSLFVLDTLYYLARTGRIGRASAWAGALLDMKPIVEHSTAVGETTPVARPRTRAKALRHLLEIMAERVGDSPVHVNVHHGDDLEGGERLKSQIASQFNCVELHLTDFTPAMGVHAGPGLLAVSFYAE